MLLEPVAARAGGAGARGARAGRGWSSREAVVAGRSASRRLPRRGRGLPGRGRGASKGVDVCPSPGPRRRAFVASRLLRRGRGLLGRGRGLPGRGRRLRRARGLLRRAVVAVEVFLAAVAVFLRRGGLLRCVRRPPVEVFLAVEALLARRGLLRRRRLLRRRGLSRRGPVSLERCVDVLATRAGSGSSRRGLDATGPGVRVPRPEAARARSSTWVGEARDGRRRGSARHRRGG